MSIETGLNTPKSELSPIIFFKRDNSGNYRDWRECSPVCGISCYSLFFKRDDLRGSNTKKNFVCFNAIQFIFGQVLGHGTTNIKISFSKLPLPWLPC